MQREYITPMLEGGLFDDIGALGEDFLSPVGKLVTARVSATVSQVSQAGIAALEDNTKALRGPKRKLDVAENPDDAGDKAFQNGYRAGLATGTVICKATIADATLQLESTIRATIPLVSPCAKQAALIQELRSVNSNLKTSNTLLKLNAKVERQVSSNESVAVRKGKRSSLQAGFITEEDDSPVKKLAGYLWKEVHRKLGKNKKQQGWNDPNFPEETKKVLRKLLLSAYGGEVANAFLDEELHRRHIGCIPS